MPTERETEMKRLVCLSALLIAFSFMAGCDLFKPSVPKLPVLWNSAPTISGKATPTKDIVITTASMSADERQAISMAPLITGFIDNTISADVGTTLTSSVMSVMVSTTIEKDSSGNTVFTSTFPDGICGSILIMKADGTSFDFVQNTLFYSTDENQYWFVNATLTNASVNENGYTGKATIKLYWKNAIHYGIAQDTISVKSVDGWIGIWGHYPEDYEIGIVDNPTVDFGNPDTSHFSDYIAAIDAMITNNTGTANTGMDYLIYYENGAWQFCMGDTTTLWNSH
jgi:hypothetical protein